LSRVLDRIEHESDEVVIMRNDHAVARLIPGAPVMTAIEALGDLYRTLPDKEGEQWIRDSRRPGGRLDKELRDPWA
jgi:antitoxin (DNA-binding transcriptional repressor) of toxin-antitoxin stability system